jgi:nucleotide-binding universal stress UspA family protein
MASLERILVPTDFSPGSHAALGYALFLGARMGATLEVLHVYDAVEAMGPDAKVVVEGKAPQPLQQLLRDRAAGLMDRFVKGVPGIGELPVRTRVEAGKSAEAILRIADKERFDLIVMGTHGRTGLSRLMVGSVAERVIRDAPCPVMTVRVPSAD